MRSLDHYTREMNDVAIKAGKDKGLIGGGSMAWTMMIIGVIVTGTMTYSLTHKGMNNSALWRQWVDFAAFLPVTLLEGSALALIYGRHHWFRSSEQRGIANVASWLIWIVLAVTSVAHFALSGIQDRTIDWLLGVYASYILPLTIVAVPMLWKRLYDLAPESAMRVAILEAEAALRSQLVEVQKEQNDLLISAYRSGMDTPRVTQARQAIFEQASIEHAKNIVGFIEGAEDRAGEQETKPRKLWRGGQVINGEDRGNYPN